MYIPTLLISVSFSALNGIYYKYNDLPPPIHSRHAVILNTTLPEEEE
jgi:hypothetical protein